MQKGAVLSGVLPGQGGVMSDLAWTTGSALTRSAVSEHLAQYGGPAAAEGKGHPDRTPESCDGICASFLHIAHSPIGLTCVIQYLWRDRKSQCTWEGQSPSQSQLQLWDTCCFTEASLQHTMQRMS